MLICLRIIIELHKQFRPPISQEVRGSLLIVLYVYTSVKYIVAWHLFFFKTRYIFSCYALNNKKKSFFFLLPPS